MKDIVIEIETEAIEDRRDIAEVIHQEEENQDLIQEEVAKGTEEIQGLPDHPDSKLNNSKLIQKGSFHFYLNYKTQSALINQSIQLSKFQSSSNKKFVQLQC